MFRIGTGRNSSDVQFDNEHKDLLGTAINKITMIRNGRFPETEIPIIAVISESTK